MSNAMTERMAQLTRGGQLAVQGDYAPIFMLKPGMYPATIIGIEGPWPRKPEQYRPKGSMRLSFRLRFDGLEKLLKGAGIEMPPEDRMYWYDPQVSYNYPLSETHPPTYNGDEPMPWTKDDAKIAEYSKLWSKTAAYNGMATIYGGFQEAGAVNFDEKGVEFIDFGEVIGARVYAVVEAFSDDAKKSWVSKIMGLTAPRAMRAKLDADPSTNTLTLDQCLHLNNWPRAKDQEDSNGTPVTPTPSMIGWFSEVVKTYEQSDPPMMEAIKVLVQQAATSCGATEPRFSRLLGATLHSSVLQDIAQILAEGGHPLPTLPSEPWASTVAGRYSQIVNADSKATADLV